jgi:hypothetical protein
MSKSKHVFDVLQNHFEKSAARHVRNGNRAKAASDHFRKCFTKAEMGDGDDNPYSALCDLLDELVGECVDAATSDIESCKACMKANSDEIDKTMRVRAAGPSFNVDPQFAKIVAVDEDLEQWRA